MAANGSLHDAERVDLQIHKQHSICMVLDYGSQYTQLIARRVRENNVCSLLLPGDATLVSHTDWLGRSHLLWLACNVYLAYSQTFVQACVLEVLEGKLMEVSLLSCRKGSSRSAHRQLFFREAPTPCTQPMHPSCQRDSMSMCSRKGFLCWEYAMACSCSCT